MHIVPVTLLILLSFAAAYSDLRWARLPNALTFGAAALGLAVNLGLGGIDGLGSTALGWVVGLALLAIPYLLRGIAAGDVKLLAAVGAIGGVGFVLPTFFAAAILGGVVAIVAMVLRGRLVSTFTSLLVLRRPATLDDLSPASIRIPYGAVIATAVLFTLLR